VASGGGACTGSGTAGCSPTRLDQGDRVTRSDAAGGRHDMTELLLALLVIAVVAVLVVLVLRWRKD
jgi:hypothetical protein